MELNKKETELKALLMALPPDFVSAQQLLEQESYTVESISKVGTDYVWECVEEGWEYWEDVDIRSRDVVPGLHSSYICDVLSFLLRHGLDPNSVFERTNIMNDLRYLDNGYLAADALVLLFEHGGNPNLICDNDSIFENVDFEVFFDAVEQQDRQRYASLVHCWMVYLAYGAILRNGNPPAKTFRGFQLSELKNHRQFYFGISKGESWPDIHIFNKQDLWEVLCA